MKCKTELRKQDPGDQSSTPWPMQHKRNPSPDVDLANAAVNAIECLTTVPLETVRVTAHNGLLRLEGTVSGEHQRIILEEVTRHLPGVRQVIDAIRIEAPV